MHKLYRPNVAAFVLNNKGEILLCERSDVRGAWQLPQGGIEAGEDPETALYRELEEEIGTSEVEIIAKLPQIIRYDWPEILFKRGFHGQEQHFFLVRLKEGSEPNIEIACDEFIDSQWVSRERFIDLVQGFKREAYLQALGIFCNSHRELIFCE